MLTLRFVLAFVAVAAFAAAPARAGAPNAEAAKLVAGFTAGDPVAPDRDAPYPHLYQAPLFGALFAVTSSETAVDESALRYYASLHNFARANAEIARLKALHPNWTPPTNIYAAAGAGADEQPLWDLLAADRLEELRAGIALKERKQPGWKPSRDLSTKIARKGAIEELAKRSNEHKSAEALAIADADPSILHCAYMDADWRVADAFLGVGLPRRAFEIYHAIVATCPNHDERLATVRKSISRFSFEQTASLIAMGAKSADGAGEFDAARIDLTRARIAAANQGKPGEAIAPEALADFLAEAKRSRGLSDLALAGWFAYNNNRLSEAEQWFSLAKAGDPAHAGPAIVNLVEGRALALLKLNRDGEALALTHVWRAASKTMRDIYARAGAALLTRTPPPHVDDATLEEYGAFVESERNAPGAEALGWYRFNRADWDDAVVWFRNALGLRDIDPAVKPMSAEVAPEVASVLEGYGRSLARAGRIDEASRVADAWRGGGVTLETLFSDLMSAAVDAAQTRSAINADLLIHYADLTNIRHGAAAADGFGWLAYRSTDYAGAIGWFRKAVAWRRGGTPDLAAAQGLALSLKQSGALSEAEEVAGDFARQSPDMQAIYLSTVVAELANKAALTPRRIERFVGLVDAVHSSAGAKAMGWYRLAQGNCSYSAPWFRRATKWSAVANEDAGAARGLALSLKAAGALTQAEDVAYAWRDRDPTLARLYFDIGVEELTREAPALPMNEARVARFSLRVLDAHDVAGARALGWRRYGEAACGFGGRWLQLAVDWSDARDAKTDEGLGLTLRATGRLAQAAELAWPWVDKAASMKKLYIDVMVEALARDNPPEPIDEARLRDFVSTIEPIKSPLGAQALGWYRLERHETAEAARWFKFALDWWPQQRRDLSQRLSAPVDDYKPVLAKLVLDIEDYRRTPLAYPNSSALIGKSREAYVNTLTGLAKTEEGYAQTLRQLGRWEEAEAIAWAWRDRWPTLRALFVDIATDALNDKAAISPEWLNRYALAIEEARSATAASAFARRATTPEAACAWFAKALRWSPDLPDVNFVDGYVRALQAQSKFAEAEQLAVRWRGKSASYDAVYLKAALHGAGGLSQAQYLGVAQEIEAARSAEGALSLGWLSYQTKEYARALDWFSKSAAWGSDKAAEGVALSLRALGRFEELATFAAAHPAPAVRAVYYDGMIAWIGADGIAPTPQVRAAFEADVVADRSAVGAGALGWDALKRRQAQAARRWFENGVVWSGADLLAPAHANATQTKLIEGYVRALRATGEAVKAEDVAYAWRDAAPILVGLYLEVAAAAAADDSVAFTPARLLRLGTVVQAQRSVDAAGALGWRFYRAGRASDATVWFERALGYGPEGPPQKKLAEGYILSLRASGRLADAEAFAYPLSHDADLRALYISDVVAELAAPNVDIGGQRLARFAALVGEARSGEGARALGWKRLSGDNCVYAAGWFAKAAAWSADGVSDAETARGYSIALAKVGAFNQAEDVAYAWREREPRMERLFLDIGATALSSEAPRLSEPRVERFSEAVLLAHDVSGARALGWKRYRQAACGFGGRWLKLAADWSDKRDAKTDEGLGLTLRKTGRLAEAAALARPWVDKVALMKKLYIDVIVEELSRDNPPEPVDEARLRDFSGVIEPMKSPLGAQALGWYRLERGEIEEAARRFGQALDWWPQRRDRSQKLSAPVDDYKPLLAKLALDIADYRRTPRAYPNSSVLVGKSREDYVQTEQGFVKTEEGYAQALRALGRVDEAERIALAERDRSPALRALYLDIAVTELNRTEGPALTPERLKAFGAAIEAERSVNAAAAFAWRQYRVGAFDGSVAWFKKALDWTQGESAPQGLIEGYVMALQGAKRFDEAEAVASKWRGVSPRLNIVFVRSELARWRAEGKTPALASLDLAGIEKAMGESKSADGALSLAWVVYEAHDYALALDWFGKAAQWGGADVAPKAKEGFALSLRALERFEQLAAFGFAERKTSSALHDAYFGGMVAWLTSDKPLRAVSAQARNDFQTAANEERSVLAEQALAWGALMRGDWAVARKDFETAIGWNATDLLTPQDGGAKLVEGYVQALRAGKEFARAEDVAFVWRNVSVALGGLYLQIVTQELAVDDDGLDDARMSRFTVFAQEKRASQAAGALGWRHYRAKTYAGAVDWFARAVDWSPGRDGDAKIDEGYALSLRAAGRLVAAEDFAWAHRDLSREIRAAYVAAFSDQLLDAKLSLNLSPLRLQRFGQIVTAEKISSGAAALGWRRLKDGNCSYASGWFRKAIAWGQRGPDDSRLYVGLAQGLRAVGLFNQAEDTAFAFADRAPEARALYVNIVIEELTRQWPHVAMSDARIGRFSSIVLADRSAAGAQALGWRRYMQAGGGYGGRWFELAARWSADGRGDAHLNEGYALSLRAVGRLAEAEALAYPWIERAPAMKKLYIDVAVEELSRDNPPAPLPEERVATFATVFGSVRSALGAQALGWYRFARGENQSAAAAFKQALDWWPQLGADANRKLSAPVDDYHAILAQLALTPENYRPTPRAYPNSSLLIGHATVSYVDTEAGLAKTVEGYVRTLAALSRYDEAEALGFRWLERWPPLRGVLVDMASAELSGAATLSPDRLARFARLVEEDRSSVGAEAFGWRAFKDNDNLAASRWLKDAIDWRADPTKLSPAVGRSYAETLGRLKRFDEALAFLDAWRGRAPGLETVAVEIGVASLAALDPGSGEAKARVEKIVSSVSAGHSAGGASALGWLAYNRKEYSGAQAWFKKAIVWTAEGEKPDPKALEGYARALQGEQRFADALRFTEQWSQRDAALTPLFLDAATQAFAAAAGSGEDIATPLLASAGRAFAQARSVNGAQALAWQRIPHKDWVSAVAWFGAAREWAKAGEVDPKTTEGLVIALRNLHRDDEAEALAYQGGETLRGLYVEIVADRLTRKPPAPPGAAEIQRFADVVLASRSASGAEALGWYSFNSHQVATAAAWFEKALGYAPTENAALGLAMAYRKLKDHENFERVVTTYRDAYARVADLGGGRGRVHERRAAAEDGVAPMKRFRTSLGAAGPAESGVAQENALGWRLLNQHRPDEAAEVFETALAGATGARRREAAYGRALTLLAAGRTGLAGRAAAEATAMTATQRHDVGVQLLERHAWDAYNADRFAEALGWLDRRAAFMPEGRSLMQLRAWCLRKLGREEAAEAVDTLLERQLAP